MKITEDESGLPKSTPIKEVMNIFIPNIDPSLPNRNGGVWCICGSAGSGKSSMTLNLFRNSKLYKKKFNQLYYFCPEGSMLSTENHPFKNHSRVYNEINVDILDDIQDELITNKMQNLEDGYEQEYNCIVIDDMSDRLKDKDIQKCLRRHLIKSRHANCMWIIITQSWNMIPLVLRKLVFYTTIFKPRNGIETELLRKEVIAMNENDTNQLLDYTFDEPYNFLTIDNVSGTYSKNFNKLHIEREKK